MALSAELVTQEGTEVGGVSPSTESGVDRSLRVITPDADLGPTNLGSFWKVCDD